MPSRRSRYRNLWYQPNTGPELRERYSNDLAAYLAAYKLRWSDAEILKHQEEGMRDFVALERRILNREKWRSHVDPYKAAGKASLEVFLDALCTGERSLSPESDFLFAAIDFEGDGSLVGGAHGYGCAILDTRGVLTGKQERQATCTIDGANFRVARHNQGFLFGDTERIEPEDLRDTIIKSLTIHSCQTPRKVVLVGHGIEADLRTFQHLKVDLSKDLPHVIGFVDTANIARQSLGQFPSLRALLQWLRIPHRRDLLHCAGNDAMFTMQAFLALAYRQSKVISSAWPALDLHRLAYREIDIPVREKNTEEDWESHLLEEGDSGIELWG
ncbi:hypothetical protein PRZ48_014394 [Zasmidium cellare]|uniref:Gfd2/YDR514C-like C-terminal domain-containing protein n=1 Tax=Zasmidium cellare TaxID=395010 RepID=A0ABR0DYT1_ZASCE|nr:hypothetical protein PRZ48_014394 [Zasmidium cellare]